MVRHARATSVQVCLAYGERALTVEVVDDGMAGSPGTERNGLRGMRERVTALGGQVLAVLLVMWAALALALVASVAAGVRSLLGSGTYPRTRGRRERRWLPREGTTCGLPVRPPAMGCWAPRSARSSARSPSRWRSAWPGSARSSTSWRRRGPALAGGSPAC